MKHLLVVALSLYCCQVAVGQEIHGKVFKIEKDGERAILPGTTIKWVNAEHVASSDENGTFSILTANVNDKRLVFSYEGFIADTVIWTGQSYLSATLKPDLHVMEAVDITQKTGMASGRHTITNTEVLGLRELSMAACCDLAGCFGTQSAVQAHATNAVTNAQELRLLGISGVYNQVLFEGVPLISGLSYTYGVSTYPGSLVGGIHISKGTTSVLQGFESISGQINVEGRKPETSPPVFLNAYVNSFQEKHLNANFATSVGKRGDWKTLLALHTVQPGKRVDNNDDNFLDLPLLTRYMVYNNWTYNTRRDAGFTTQIGWRIVHENRIGGEQGYDPDRDGGSNSIYGQDIQFTQPELFIKSGYRFSPTSSLQLNVSGFAQDQSSWFGSLRYLATQYTAQANLQHEWNWHDSHTLKYGVSYRFQDLNEEIRLTAAGDPRSYAGKYLNKLDVPGVYAENTILSKNGYWSLITGLRLDHHQEEGWILTPRAMAKIDFSEQHTLRASAGTGWRQVNVFSEHINLLGSSRDVIFEERLNPERATTWGLSHTWTFWAGTTNFVFSGDFYQTLFDNQFSPDYDTDPTKAYIRNFTGESRSNGLQLEGSVQFASGFEFRTAYNYLDVYKMKNGEKEVLPFNSKNRVMGAASYTTPNDRWQFDANAHWFGRMRLPNTANNPVEFRRPDQSEAYATVNVQATALLGALEVYAGCENIMNYKQKDPIIAANDPFSPYFDISSAWGPIRGREFYLGLRYTIN